MFELWSPDDAFGHLDRYLRSNGFFGADADDLAGVIADVYLGFGLSSTMRRSSSPDPPEPCRSPLLACRIRPDRGPDPSPGPFRVGPWTPTWTSDAHAGAIEAVRDSIASGDVYQVNLVQHLEAPFAGDPFGLAAALAGLRPRHPRPMVGVDWAIVSASPELFLARRGELLVTMPIKGTRPAGGAAELRASEKDAAEHVMIVDLERNDLGRVSIPGTVRWPDLMAPRSMAGVEHLVSTVTGHIRADAGLPELLAALFPGGSVTGAPKIAALDQIASLEPVGRGASMGALGVVHPNGDFDLALTIRTFAISQGRIHLWVGGGIVWDSDPLAEVEESWVKARPLLAAIEAAASNAPRDHRAAGIRPPVGTPA